jgi:hypothetical protein
MESSTGMQSRTSRASSAATRLAAPRPSGIGDGQPSRRSRRPSNARTHSRVRPRRAARERLAAENRRRLLRLSVRLATSVNLLRRPDPAVLSDAHACDLVPMLTWVWRDFDFDGITTWPRRQAGRPPTRSSDEQLIGKVTAAPCAGVSCGTAYFASVNELRYPAPGELRSPRAGRVTRIGGRPKGCEWTPYSAYR